VLKAGVPFMQTALTDVMGCFRIGANSVLSTLFGRRIDRILFAATKADQLHHTSHDRLEDILKVLVAAASEKAAFTGAAEDIAALASIRATREATVTQRSEVLPCIAGTPQAEENIAGKSFDGATEAAVFPGDLPADPKAALDGRLAGQLHFVRFRPPLVGNGSFPHIRLDRALEFLIGDRFP
jgi:predicted YcjX-like family ATPase